MQCQHYYSISHKRGQQCIYVATENELYCFRHYRHFDKCEIIYIDLLGCMGIDIGSVPSWLYQTSKESIERFVETGDQADYDNIMDSISYSLYGKSWVKHLHESARERFREVSKYK